MVSLLVARFKQGRRTMEFPAGPAPQLSDRFRGRPVFDASKCPEGCVVCQEACPTQAIQIEDKPCLDLGRCLFCTDCLDSCPEGAISYAHDYQLATRRREDLMLQPETELKLAEALDGKLLKLFGRSLRLRQVSAGGCNGCESDVNVLNTIVWDLSRFGIQFVASPRHADGLLVTGPVTRNMSLALRKTYDAVPDPKLVIAVGAYADHEQVGNGVDSALPVDLFIPGCPPQPITILDGLLRLLGRLENGRAIPA